MEDVLSGYLQGLTQWLIDLVPNLVKAIFIAAFGWLIARLAKYAIQRTAKRFGWDNVIWDYLGKPMKMAL